MEDSLSDGVTPRTMVEAVLQQKSVSDSEVRPRQSRRSWMPKETPVNAPRRSLRSVESPGMSLRKHATVRNFIKMQTPMDEQTPRAMIQDFLNAASEETPLIPRSQPVPEASEAAETTTLSTTLPLRKRRSLHEDSFLGSTTRDRAAKNLQVPKQTPLPSRTKPALNTADLSTELPSKRKKRSLHEDSFGGSSMAPPPRVSPARLAKKSRKGLGSNSDFAAGVQQHMGKFQEKKLDNSSSFEQSMNEDSDVSIQQGGSESEDPIPRDIRRSSRGAERKRHPSDSEGFVPPTDIETDFEDDPLLAVNRSIRKMDRSKNTSNINEQRSSRNHSRTENTYEVDERSDPIEPVASPSSLDRSNYGMDSSRKRRQSETLDRSKQTVGGNRTRRKSEQINGSPSDKRRTGGETELENSATRRQSKGLERSRQSTTDNSPRKSRGNLTNNLSGSLLTGDLTTEVVGVEKRKAASQKDILLDASKSGVNVGGDVESREQASPHGGDDIDEAGEPVQSQDEGIHSEPEQDQNDDNQGELDNEEKIEDHNSEHGQSNTEEQKETDIAQLSPRLTGNQQTTRQDIVDQSPRHASPIVGSGLTPTTSHFLQTPQRSLHGQGDVEDSTQYSSVFSPSSMSPYVGMAYEGYSPMMTPVLSTSVRESPALRRGASLETDERSPLASRNANRVQAPARGRRGPGQGTQKKKSVPPARLPSSLTKSIFRHFCNKTVSKEAMAAVEDMTDEYWENVTKDLKAYSQHARRETIDESDIDLLMKRQRFVTDKESMYTLVEKYLPMEYRQEIIPVARAGNKVFPPKSMLNLL